MAVQKKVVYDLLNDAIVNDLGRPLHQFEGHAILRR